MYNKVQRPKVAEFYDPNTKLPPRFGIYRSAQVLIQLRTENYGNSSIISTIKLPFVLRVLRDLCFLSIWLYVRCNRIFATRWITQKFILNVSWFLILSITKKFYNWNCNWIELKLNNMILRNIWLTKITLKYVVHHHITVVYHF